MSMRVGLRRRVVKGVVGITALVLAASVSACSGDASTPPQDTWSPRPSATQPPSTPEQGATAEADPVRNDLARLPLKRAINAGPLTVNVEYGTRLNVRDWKPGTSKPLQISLTAVNRKKQGQKIYLSKATATVSAFDDRGQIGESGSVNDTANINPGYIVTFPNTYNQSLALPPVDTSASSMTIDLTYEFVLEVDRTKQGRDFAKQVATDTIVVPFNS